MELASTPFIMVDALQSRRHLPQPFDILRIRVWPWLSIVVIVEQIDPAMSLQDIWQVGGGILHYGLEML
jgi:hypothetical protein